MVRGEVSWIASISGITIQVRMIFFLLYFHYFFDHVFLQSIFSYLGNVVDDVNNNRVQAMFSSPYRSQINVQLHDST